MRKSAVAAWVSLVVPFVLFCGVYALLAFSLHHEYPEICYMIVAFLGLGVIVLGAVAWNMALRQTSDEEDDEPKWWTFRFATSLVAWIVGVILGRLVFWNYNQPYYSYLDLDTYTNVNPAKMSGELVMDAGRITFTNNTMVDLRKSVGFRNSDTYCVAPITVDGLPLNTYDFWAVGLGCCTSSTADFHCGESLNLNAHAGLRMLDDARRPFFRLAVQQAEETHQIRATHPIFLYWTQDSTAGMEWIRDEGIKYYVIGMIVHFSWQAFCVLLVVLASSKLRPSILSES